MLLTFSLVSEEPGRSQRVLEDMAKRDAPESVLESEDINRCCDEVCASLKGWNEATTGLRQAPKPYSKRGTLLYCVAKPETFLIVPTGSESLGY
jgi:hypothetical protein